MANFATVQLLSSGALILLLATTHPSPNVVTCQSTITDDGSASISADEAAQFQANYAHDIGRISAGNAPVASSPPLPRAAPTFASAPTTPSAGAPSVMAPPTGGSNSQPRSSRGQVARQQQQAQATSRIAARPNRLAGRQRTTAASAITNEDTGSDHYQSVSQAELMAQVNAERRRQAAQQMLDAANAAAAAAEQPASNSDESDLGQEAAAADNAQPLTPTQSQNHLRPSSHQATAMNSIGSPLSALSAPQPVALAAPVDSAQLQPTYLQRTPASPTLSAPPSSSADDQVEPAAASQLQPFGSATDANSANQAAAASTNSATDFEPLPAPSFEHVLGQGCPMKGVFSYENKDHCDKYYLCTNGTFTEENCPNGLAYSQMGAVYQHCAYNWNVDCGKKKVSEPIASRGCPWQFGIFPVENNGRCSIDYYVCEWGVPETKRCTPEGLFYDDRIKGCQWADQLGCKSEALLNFKCPPEDEDNPYWPYPRYYHSQRDVIVCVNEQPRLVHCNDDQTVEPSSLACIDIVKKKKKKKQF